MVIERLVLKLSTALIKYPRAAFSLGAIIVILVLGVCLKFIFFQNDARNERERTDNVAEIKELKTNVVALQFAKDSLLNLTGELRDDCKQKELDATVKANAQLQAFNDQLTKRMAEMEEKLLIQKRSTTVNQNLAKKISGQ